MTQRSKMGYFDKMTDQERTNFDQLSDKLRTSRTGKFSAMDKNMSDIKSQSGFSKMDRNGKNSFLCDVSNNM